MCLVDSERKLRWTWRQRWVRRCWVCTTGEPPLGEACLKMGRSFQWDAGVMLLAASTEGEYVARVRSRGRWLRCCSWSRRTVRMSLQALSRTRMLYRYERSSRVGSRTCRNLARRCNRSWE